MAEPLPLVFIETTIPSYLTARPCRDIIRTAHQQITREWWAERSAFHLFISQLVLTECGRGDPQMAADRLAVLSGLTVLKQTPTVEGLADDLMKEVRLPPQAEYDAIHIATAAAHGMNFLVTWNCAHIANVALRPRIDATCRNWGLDPPLICTPDQLMPRRSQP